MERGLTRRAAVARVLGALGALGLPSGARATNGAPRLEAIAVTSARGWYRGDRRLLATVSPGIRGRDRATIRFDLDRRATVGLEAIRTGSGGAETVVWSDRASFPPGRNAFVWEPALGDAPGTHVMRLTVQFGGRRRVYGARRPASPDRAVAPVVHVLGVEAAFLRRSFVPEERMPLRIFADAASLTLTFLRCGAEAEASERIDDLNGVAYGEPVQLGWAGKRSAPAIATVQTGDWPSGLYAARLETGDGRVGFAPFVLHGKNENRARQAVVLPTKTWQAYNFYDRDGDGWGDTWYAGGEPAVRLDRPFRDRGVPPRYKRYVVPFLQFLHRNGLTPDYLVDDDLDVLSGDELRRRYDLVVFPGHTEYVTTAAYDAIRRFRDLGGRLVFLSANNFFWRVDRRGNSIARVRRWRDLGLPEAAVLGVQYRGNDDGSARRPFTVVAAGQAPWLFEGTGLVNGSLLGAEIGGYGIEIDAVAPASPPGTIVLARIEALYGRGFDAEMTYYETAAGARVFAAGTLDFTGSSRTPVVTRMLLNLWRHMLEDVPSATA